MTRYLTCECCSTCGQYVKPKLNKGEHVSRRRPYIYKPYDARKLICASHAVYFVRYMNCERTGHFTYSHGCPVCVGLIRAKVQKEMVYWRNRLHQVANMRSQLVRKANAKRKQKIITASREFTTRAS